LSFLEEVHPIRPEAGSIQNSEILTLGREPWNLILEVRIYGIKLMEVRINETSNSFFNLRGAGKPSSKPWDAANDFK
jgi:hypothetical protein